MRYLLDTNTCIAVMRKKPTVVRRMTAVSFDECAVSTITTYELFTGIEKCPSPAKERARVDLFLKTVQALPFDDGAARAAGRMRALLESQGQSIGPYDYLLAGHASTLSLILVSANTREFERIPGLIVKNWEL